jgi:hypothetical protein
MLPEICMEQPSAQAVALLADAAASSNSSGQDQDGF